MLILTVAITLVAVGRANCISSVEDDAVAQALVLLRVGEIRPAVDSLINANNTDDVNWKATAALLCLATGHFNSAYEIATSALKQCRDETTMLVAGLAALGAGDHESAIKAFTELLSLQPRANRQLPLLFLNILGVNADVGKCTDEEPCAEAVKLLHSFLKMQRGEYASAKEMLIKLSEMMRNRTQSGSDNMKGLIKLSVVSDDDGIKLVMLTPRAKDVPAEEIERLASMHKGEGAKSVSAKASLIRHADATTLLSIRRGKQTQGSTNEDGVRLLSGRVRISVDVSAFPEASQVSFHVDCEERFRTSKTPFEWEWDTTAEPPGKHTLTILVLRRDGSVCAASTQKVYIASSVINTTQQRTTTEGESAFGKQQFIRRVATGTTNSKTEHAQTRSISSFDWRANMQPNSILPPIRLLDVDDESVELMLGLAHEATGDLHSAFHELGKLYLRTRNEALVKHLVRLRKSLTSGSSTPLLITSAPTNKRAVALTFDDGPRTPYTEQILHTLSRYGVRATFFVVGEMVREYPELLRAIVSAGHEVGNHSYSHTPARMLSKDDIECELLLTDILISEVCGIHPTLFRPPGGGINDALISALIEQNYSCVRWNINIGEHRGTPQQIAVKMLNAVKPGSIILMHNGMDASPDVLPYLLDGLQRLGYEVMPLGELLKVRQVRCSDFAEAR
jgi:peptidoglycan/xylan/chitin deacetylase (PgdA/CDA1 family)